MRFPRSLVPLLLLPLSAAADWRIDLLEEEGVGTTPKALREAAAGFATKSVDLAAEFARLGAEDYPTRERAQRKILAAGPEAAKWLRARDVPDDPEVRIRTEAILQLLELPSIGNRDRMFAHAVESLLEEGGKPGSEATGGIFFEWFGEASATLDKGYRSLRFEDPQGFGGKVGDGRLILPGSHQGDNDQRLILHARDWPGRAGFPDRFRVSAKLGGTAAGAGAWHMGLSIGRVRALFHPGLRNGCFRFEQVGTSKNLSPNEDMNFTPSTSALQRMVIDVRRLADRRVALAVRIDQDGTCFEAEIVLNHKVIGPLDQVSMDRSGRTGGDAAFDDFAIEILPR